MEAVVAVLVGLLYANFLEWSIHRYVLHGLGKKRSSRWSFHFHEHHKIVRQWDGGDPQYLCILGSGPEIKALSLLTISHLPLLFFFPVFASTLMMYSVVYYIAHRKSHIDPNWAKRWLPWHYDHHMHHQNHNWCVVFPLFDYILGTRKKPDAVQ